MKKAMLAVVLVFVFASMSTANKTMKNSPDGFRGIKWGDPVSALGETARLIEEDKLSEAEFYLRTDEEMSLGGASLHTVAYVFWKGKFTTVIIRCNGSSDFDALKAVAVERFGTPVKPNRFIESYGWLDDNALVSVSKNPATLMIASMRFYKEREAEKEGKAKSGAVSDF